MSEAQARLVICMATAQTNSPIIYLL